MEEKPKIEIDQGVKIISRSEQTPNIYDGGLLPPHGDDDIFPFWEVNNKKENDKPLVSMGGSVEKLS